MPSINADLPFDPDSLRDKYRQERDKRIRRDGDHQYIEVAGEFARYDDDPYVEPGFTRDAVDEDVDVAVIGGGFAGLLAATRLREAGITDIRIIESGSDFGGTWYWNRYPGAQCDIDSYCYLPLLEETNYIPKEKYSFAPEIFEHARRIGETFGLYDVAYFQTKVTELRWYEPSRRWVVSTNRGDKIRARFVVQAAGPLNRPKLPGIAGIDQFEGHTFHTSRWDYAYTGGDHNGNLSKLCDKRVAVIGTGATAIQCVPHLGAAAKHLYVFQRTPSSVDLRGNKPTDPQWAQSLQPGWQRRRRENFNDVVTGQPFEEDMVHDGWTEIFRSLQTGIPFGSSGDQDPKEIERLAEIADFRKMNQIRARVDATVKDAATAEALKPWYRQFCKRPTFNDEYLATFNRPNVELIDVSRSHGVERITKTGIVANGTEYPVDCVIFATGFEVTTSPQRRVSFKIVGRRDKSLFEHWNRGLRTLHGFSSHGFPNWFFVGISQNGFSVNMTSTFDDQAQHIAYIIKQAAARGATRVEVSQKAEQLWVDEVKRLAGSNRSFAEACTPGLFNNDGLLDKAEGNLIGESYAPGANAFNALLAEWRAKGDLNGYELS